MSHPESSQQKKSIRDWLQTFALPIILALFFRFGPTTLPEWVSDFLGIAIILTVLAGAVDVIYPHVKGWRRKHGGVDVEKLIVKRAFYAPFSRDKVIPTIGKLLESKSFMRGRNDPTNFAGDFYKSPVLYMKQLTPERWQELLQEKAPNRTDEELDNLVTETNKRVQFRSTTPTDLKVRVISEFQGESYCEACAIYAAPAISATEALIIAGSSIELPTPSFLGGTALGLIFFPEYNEQLAHYGAAAIDFTWNEGYGCAADIAGFF